MGLDDPLAAFALDETALVLGRYVEGELAEGRKLEDALASFGRERGGDGKYRDARGLAVKKIRIGPDGIW